MFRQLLFLLLIALGPALLSGALQLNWQPIEPLLPGEVRPGTAKLWGHHVLWVDARSHNQFQTGHLPQAVLLNPDEWQQQVPAFFAAWESNKTIVVYGQDARDPAAQIVANRIGSELKVETVYVLKGGWQAWSRL